MFSLTYYYVNMLLTTAVVRPLPKRLGLQLILSNYRPVSNLTFVSKIIECCMLLQLSQHCDNYDLQPDYQSAYREHYSCETAVLKVSNDILWAMESQAVTSLVTLDLSAAFDTMLTMTSYCLYLEISMVYMVRL